MASKFKVGDHVTWNSEAGHVSGRIVKIHTENVNYKGYVHHASKEDPQYEIKSEDGSYRLAQDSSAEAPSPVINLYNP
jgi:hypothetical protein